MKELFAKIFRDPKRELVKFRALVDAINAKEKDYKPLSDSALLERAGNWRQAFADLKASPDYTPQKLQDKMDELLPDVFAAVRTAAERTLGERHYDVQLIGGIVLHQGRIAEMKTGEGKTLVATLPVALNALTGNGVHVVTVNDYLARRDSEWMGVVYDKLGLTVGALQNMQFGQIRRDLYLKDICYGTNSEFGFDYLRDNMVISARERVQRERWFAIVDEVDSILVDEARTPLIISGAGEHSNALYEQINEIIPGLAEGVHYEKDEKEKHVMLTEEGVEKVEVILRNRGLLVSPHMYDPENSILLHHVNQALRSHVLFLRDREYVVEGDEVIIVDEFTGRKMFGRRYSDGLHQAIEAKEKVRVKNENQTLATITIQNYYRLYQKLAGMTGTAKTEEEEFVQIYGLSVVEIPTNVPVTRKDHPDLVYATQMGKYRAIVEETAECHKRGQPVLIGTVSVAVSELIAELLSKKNVPHNVLNAKHHEREAEIIQHAGEKGAVTVATNMAGRGTDIKLTPEVKALGGLVILGSERHESRRIDNQLRGRSGRQGDPGESRFFISLEDDLMRIFGSERVKSLMTSMGMSDEAPLEHSMLTKAIENAQKKVEAHNFEIRKHVLKYDDIMEKQRNVIYNERDRILRGDVITDMIEDMLELIIDARMDRYAIEGTKPVEWELETLLESVKAVLPIPQELTAKDLEFPKRAQVKARLLQLAKEAYAAKEAQILEAATVRAEAEGLSDEEAAALMGPEHPQNLMRQIERYWTLRMIDRHWIRHLYALDSLRDGIGLQGYGQRDPLVEYTRESYVQFQVMRDSMRADILRSIFATHFQLPQQPQALRQQRLSAPIAAEAGVPDLEHQQSSYKVRTVSGPVDGGPTGAGAVAGKSGNGASPVRQQVFTGGASYRARAQAKSAPTPTQPVAADDAADDAEESPEVRETHRASNAPGRNDPCWCGSGKKYKACHYPQVPVS
ncbi:MAG: Protein translocase subunit SecA 1 [bacterium]|nr:Protein translocase subunit SecA 1 [bacterium]